MDFPIFHLDFIGNRMLIAIIGILHVIISHGLAVGFVALITFLEYLGYRKSKYNPEQAKQWDEMARKMMFVGFIISTGVGALTGVGIWFSTSLVSPDAIGSLIRVFYAAWFAEWFVFLVELVLVMIYFLRWPKSNQSPQAKKNHIQFGAILSIFSWLTVAVISGILAFMMSPGSWLSKRSFLNGFTNPNFIPHLYFRTTLAMMLAGAFGLLLALIFTKKGNEIREKSVSFISLWLLVWTPVVTAGAFLYRSVIPETMYGNLPTAIATKAFSKWYDSLLLVIIGTVVLTVLIAAWGFLKPRRLPGAMLVFPLLTMLILIGAFERVREFIRKPFVISEYMYANGLRVRDYPLYQKDGVLAHATYVSTPTVTGENKIEAGRNVFMLTCSRCHTVTGNNAIARNFKRMLPPGEALNLGAIIQYIPKMHNVHYYMPPFPGNKAEMDALAAFILEMDKSPRPLRGVQMEGTPISTVHSVNRAIVGDGKVSLVPIPRDVPLPFPLPGWLLVAILVLSFLLHILFVNFMLGGSILTLWAERRAIKRNDPSYERLAREIADTVTVNKSLAVVLGVAPLLTINAFYTLYFYSSNALTGVLWLSIVVLVSTAFLLLYTHKFTWEKYKNKKQFHISLIVVAVVIFLFVPFIFLTNINLMLFPGKWGTIKGFFSAMFLANVIPRYFHFITASLAVTGLFLFGYMKQRRYPFETVFKGGSFSRNYILRKWYRLALFASLAQLGFGPLNFFTLPWHAVTWKLVFVLLTGISFAITAMILLWRELKGPDEELGKRFYLIAGILTITVLFMGTGRHVYRATALNPHQEQIQQRTMTSTPGGSFEKPPPGPP
ncbi:MAG TPA: c-type cytochrome [Candidatus Deferrimicrobium sp.]|nr:c-type cytochrome [Candidatus Deferrimicrobium sp.]